MNGMDEIQVWIDQNLQPPEERVVDYSYKDKEIYEGEFERKK